MPGHRLGSILVSLFAPDKYGSSRDVVLGFDDVSGYENDTASLGCNVGRCANRIGGASFTLNGTTYTLDKNDGENCLHSGFHQYSKRIWTVKEHTDTAITLTLNSPDMDQGFPGALTMSVTYRLEENTLHISYEATPDKDTIINMTNHSYFNLNGSGDIRSIWSSSTPAASPLPTRSPSRPESMPTWRAPRWISVSQRRSAQEIGADYTQLLQGRGYDHNYVIDDYDGARALRRSSVLGIFRYPLDLSTDYPGIQMYTANYLEDAHGKNSAVYHRETLSVLSRSSSRTPSINQHSKSGLSGRHIVSQGDCLHFLH